jgi:hypothetical protein
MVTCFDKSEDTKVTGRPKEVFAMLWVGSNDTTEDEMARAEALDHFAEGSDAPVNIPQFCNTLLVHSESFYALFKNLEQARSCTAFQPAPNASFSSRPASLDHSQREFAA